VNVVGLDLSLTASGIASTRGWCTVVGRAGLTVAATPLAERLAGMRALKQQLLDTIGAPDLVCIETPALSRARGGVFERGWLWFEVATVLELDRDVAVVGVDPGQLKLYATGRGGASKGEVLVAVTKRWPQFETGGDDNLADAVVLAAIGADLLGEPLTPLPVTHRVALAKLRVPERIGGAP
jgi:Holliday junction resolvasome RuvABC endonuclease subunit